jgi:hypothetical protein
VTSRPGQPAIIDHAPVAIEALDPADDRSRTIKVAGPATLPVTKLHKLGERDERNPERLDDKDAHDVYRLLVSFETATLTDVFASLLTDDISAEATRVSLRYLDELFARGANALGSQMAGRAEELVGDPTTVAQSVAALAADLTVASVSHHVHERTLLCARAGQASSSTTRTSRRPQRAFGRVALRAPERGRLLVRRRAGAATRESSCPPGCRSPSSPRSRQGRRTACSEDRGRARRWPARPGAPPALHSLPAVLG